MFRFISRGTKLVKTKFKQYQKLLGEDKFWPILIFPFLIVCIGHIPIKILFLIFHGVMKLYQIIYKILKYCFGYNKSKEEAQLKNYKQNLLTSISYTNPPQNLQIVNLQSVKIKQRVIQTYFQSRRLPKNHFNLFTPIFSNDLDRIRFTKIFQKYQEQLTLDPTFKINPANELKLNYKESRAIGVMLGMAINDALGANTEFQQYKKEGYNVITNGFKDIQEAIDDQRLKDLRIKEVGIWTDDASMGIAMGYGLMMNNYQFDPMKTREMFHLWWYHGLGNGGRQESIGLGGNISYAIQEFNSPDAQAYTEKGNSDKNGNGSLMRLAPIPIVFHNDFKKASQIAMLQSLTTHNGLQAKQCCRLMAQIIVDLINRKQKEDWNEVLLNTCKNFKSEIKSVECLAKSVKQTNEIMNKQRYSIPNFEIFNTTLMDRNWNWMEPEFDYSPTRLKNDGTYIGSYCMDALAMALHVVYFSTSFKQVSVKIADKGGDCDTVGSIAGQIAGAIYGVNEQVLKLYSEMKDFTSERYEAFLIGYSLYHKKKININKDENNKRTSDKIFCKKRQ